MTAACKPLIPGKGNHDEIDDTLGAIYQVQAIALDADGYKSTQLAFEASPGKFTQPSKTTSQQVRPEDEGLPSQQRENILATA